MKQRPIWLTAAVLAVVVLLAQVAGAATKDGNPSASVAASASVSADLTGTAATMALPEQASSVATEKSAKAIANANQAVTDRGHGQTQNEVVAAAPAAAPVDASSGARPGWGCGDTNHDHSAGPPGRPGATPPPGCAKP
jgi:hypothetical protein